MLRPLILLAGSLLTHPAAAQQVRAGALVIEAPVIRVARPEARTGAGFLLIRNTGRRDDRLLSVTTDAATRSDLHGTIRDGNVMRMRAQGDGVPVPAGGHALFAPGGLHVMFIGIRRPLPPGSRVKARLLFEKVGPVDVSFTASLAGTPLPPSHRP